MPLDEIVDIALQVADALARRSRPRHHAPRSHAGEHLPDRGGLVKLLDFGLAKQFSSLDDDGRIPTI